MPIFGLIFVNLEIAAFSMILKLFIFILFGFSFVQYTKVYKCQNIIEEIIAGILHIRYRKYNLYKGVPLMKNQIFKHIQHSLPTKKYKSKNNQQLYKKQTDECFSSSEDDFMASKYHALQNPSSEKTAKNSKFISHQPSTHIDKQSLRELSNMLQNAIKNRNMEVNSKATKNETKRKAMRNDQKQKQVSKNTEVNSKSMKNKMSEGKNVRKQKKPQKNVSKKKQNPIKKQQLHNNIQQRNDKNYQTHKKSQSRDNKKSTQFKRHNQQFKKQGKLVIDLGKKNKSKQENNRTTVRAQLTTKAKLSQLRQMPSFRQYCVIKGKFIPLQSTTQRKQLQSIFAQTLCTTNGCSNYNYLSQLSQRGEQVTQRLNTIKKISQSNVQPNQVEIKTIKAQLAHYAVLVKAAQQDIGVQYSDRLNATNSSRKNIEVLKELKEQSKKQLEIQINEISNANSSQKSDRSILLEAMMKLESLEFDQNSVLQKLNLEQKRHFRQIFSSMLSKMKSPRIETPPNISRTLQTINEIQFLKGDKTSKNKMMIVQEERRDQLEQLLMMRQSRQNNQFNIVIRSPQHVDTSMLAVLACFTDIFCYVQMNCQQSLLQTMNGLYGLSYNDKYRCISRYYSQKQRKGLIYSEIQSQNLSIGIRIKMEIIKRQLTMRALPDSLFNNFMRQIAQDLNEQNINKEDEISKKFQDKSYFWMHSKAIFDSINQMLMPYRPFYPTKGDPFPWSMSPLKCLTFYSIDSESLDTVIEQAQQKLTTYIKCLCGIHIDSSIYIAEDYRQKQQTGMDDKKDIVYSIRRDKLTKCIVQDIQLDNNDDPYLQLQIENTCILQQISIDITKNLLDEFVKQFSSFLF